MTVRRPKPRVRKPATRGSAFTYLLRTCGPNGESHSGFVWPLTAGARVTAPDWRATAACGNGLHGLLMGEGDGSLLDWSETAMWLVVKVRRSEIVTIDAAKVKVPRGQIVFAGERGKAIDTLVSLGADPSKIPAGQASASGDQGQASASGTRGQASASGYQGQASASGYQGQASASGYQGQASASGDQGQASASGTRGQASASGYQGQASAEGKHGVALARYRVKAGDIGILIGFWNDGSRDRVVVKYIGEDGIKPNTWYEVRNGALVEIVGA